MRRVLPGDVTAAACVLLAQAAEARPRTLARMLAEAETADAYRLETGRLHPLWGNGSLRAAALTRPRADEPYWDDPDYAACMALVFKALVARAAPLRARR
ncbi:MAG TPA: hypothetical protein ENJ52_11310 [Aliiroseovarius sp.]|nr:hypothetical protein [Aliiroseovarius sp.]